MHVGVTAARNLLVGCLLVGASGWVSAEEILPWDSARASARIDTRYAFAKTSTSAVGMEPREREGRFHAESGAYENRSFLARWFDFGKSRSVGGDARGQVHEVARDAAERAHRASYLDHAPGLDQRVVNNDRASPEPPLMPLGGAALVSGRVRIPPYASYAGLGWRSLDSKRVGLSYGIDMGVMHFGRPRVDYALSGAALEEINAYSGSDVIRWSSEEERRAEESLGNYRYHPVVSLGLALRF